MQSLSMNTFVRESDMIPLIEDFFTKEWKSIASPVSNDFEIFSKREVGLGWGIADIVFSYFDSHSFKKDIGIPQLTLQTISVLDHLSDAEWKDLDEISTTVGISKSYLKNELLSYLLEYRIVSTKGDSQYRKTNSVNYDSTVIAIEAKLKNWKRALFQAQRYRLFANLSYVVLPHNNIKSAVENIDLFQENNVGLCSMYSDGKLEVISPAIISEPLSPRLKKLADNILLTNTLSRVGDN